MPIIESTPQAAPVKPTTPVAAPVAPIQAAPPQKGADIAALEQRVADEKRAAEVKLVRQQRKYADDLKSKESEFGKKLSRLSELERMHSQAKLNPELLFKSVLGDDYYNKMVELRINGGAPTAQTVASEIQILREEMQTTLEARDAAAEKARAEADQKSRSSVIDSARRELAKEGAYFWKAKSADYPLVGGLGTEEQIAGELARRVEAHYHATTKRDELGRMVSEGETMGLQQAAESWEGALVAIAEKAAAVAKYADRFKPKPAASAAPSHEAQQQRRTLSNDLTVSTSAPRPPANDSERRARAIAAYESISKRAQGQ